MRHGTRQLSGERARHGAWHPATGLILRRRVAGFVSAVDTLHWVHRMFSNLKIWAKGVFRSLRKRHLQRYLEEFVFRWNRRQHLRSAFDTLLGIGVGLSPTTYRDFVELRA
jgi:hypothetical protein